MIPGLEMLACQDLAVPMEVMEHVVRVESSFNPYAIGVVGARLARQPRNLKEAVATASQLERDGYNFSLGLAQVNRHNLAPQGLADYATAFATCPNLAAGARILADCHQRAGGDWGKAFSCYYSGNFTRGFRDGYVDKVHRSMAASAREGIAQLASVIPVAGSTHPERAVGAEVSLRARRSAPAQASVPVPHAGRHAAASATEGTHPVRPGPSHAPATPAPPGSPGSPANPATGAYTAGMPFVPQVTGPADLPPHVPPAAANPADSAFVF